MKRFSLALLALLVVLGGTAFAATSCPTEISVTGSGSVFLTPDQAVVNASVETNSLSAGEAVSSNNEIYSRVLSSLQSIGVPKADVSLSSYNVNYNPKPAKTDPHDTQQYGYTVSRTFEVTVRSIAKSGNVVDAVTRAGASAINSVSFGVADNRLALAKAQGMAVRDSRVQADALAAAANLHIVGIKLISYGSDDGVRPMPMMKMAAMAAPAPTVLDPSSVNVTASVSVVYLASP